MQQVEKHIVNFEWADRELIAFLSDRFEISRRKAKQLIDERVVYVNKKCVWIAHHKLKEGDVIELPYDAIKKGMAQKQNFRLLYSDKEYFIVDKPAGILTNQGKGSMESILQAQMGSSEIRAVHRLDKYTSGCVIFAKHFEAFERIIELFKSKKVLKRYIAIVVGKVGKTKMTLTFPIEGTEAITEVEVINAQEDASLLRIFPKTGRTHQIRIHLATIGHPIIGDKQYGVGKMPLLIRQMVLRQMLHADLISFVSPYTGKKIKAYSEIPVDFLSTLKLLKLT